MQVIITCPRCEGGRCELNPEEMFCEDCLLMESSPNFLPTGFGALELLRLWEEHLDRAFASNPSELSAEPLGNHIENLAFQENE